MNGVIHGENVTARIGLMTELDDERRKQRAEILFSCVLEVEEEIGKVN